MHSTHISYNERFVHFLTASNGANDRFYFMGFLASTNCTKIRCAVRYHHKQTEILPPITN